MKLKALHTLTAAALLCGGALLSSSAFAQGTFLPGSGTSVNCNIGGSGASTDTKTCTAGSVTTTMTAWSFTSTLDGTARTGFTKAIIADWDTSGIGVRSGSKETGGTGGLDAQHGFDNMTSGCTGSSSTSLTVGTATVGANCGGSIEALLLDFSTTGKVNLSSVGIGWDNNVDTDLSVWVWTGAGGPSMSGQTAAGSTTTTGTTAASMAGWTLVSNLDMGLSSPVAKATGGSLYSSYFLITTYFGANAGGFNAGNDGFKLSSFTVGTCAGTLIGTGSSSTCKVSEPGSLALAGVAFLGVVAARRRKVTLVRNAA